jgi:hypothetical protein
MLPNWHILLVSFNANQRFSVEYSDTLLETWAEEAVREVGSYAEYSPSGTGLHAFALGTVEKSAQFNGCEIYSKGRFFTVTGKTVPNCPAYEFRPYTGLSQFRERIRTNKLRPYRLHKPDSGENRVYERVETAAAAQLFEAYVVHCEPEEMFGLEIEIPQGERHNTFNSIAGWLHDGERDEDDIFEILHRVYDEYCLGEDMSSDELRSIAEWIVQQKPCFIEPRDLPTYAIGLRLFRSKEEMEAWPDTAIARVEEESKEKIPDPEKVKDAIEAVALLVLERIRQEQLIKKLAGVLDVKKDVVADEVAKVIEEHRKLQENANQKNWKAEHQEIQVNPAQLISNLEQCFEERLHLPKGAALALACFVLNTRVFNLFETTPYICLESAVKRCGKSTALPIINCLSSKSVIVTSVNAAIFRLIDKERPTLCLDESEMLAGNSEKAEEVRAVLNEGYKQGGRVPRCVGDKFEVAYFRVYCPKVIASIGGLKGALHCDSHGANPRGCRAQICTY